jgi:ribose transport system ATP-binding protein
MLELRNVSKSFPGVKALSDVSFSIQAGEVHAICGENGAGKSTLMNILTGHLSPDEGSSIWLDGQQIALRDVNDAAQHGIGIVYQERSLVGTLSIAENLCAGHYPRHRYGWIDYAALYADTKNMLQQLGLAHCNPKQLVASCSAAEQQMIELGKALYRKPRLLILDEPTAGIGDKETQILFGIIRQLRAEGRTVVYISHRLAEIFTIADRVTVLRDGQWQQTLPVADTNADDLVRYMTGRKIERLDAATHTVGETVLEVHNLQGQRFNNVTFSVRAGEIVGMAGLVGAGRTEIARAIFGADPLLGGTVQFAGKTVSIHHPVEAMQLGIGYVPEERKNLALFMDRSVTDNILAGVYAGRRFPRPAEQRQIAENFKTQLNIRTPDVQQPVRLLSGGNQQKCVLARWLHLNPRLLIVDEPTHGIDVGAKFEIYTLLQQLARQGTAILLISSELPEVLTLADRILVVANGTLRGEVTRAEASEERLLHLMN